MSERLAAALRYGEAKIARQDAKQPQLGQIKSADFRRLPAVGVYIISCGDAVKIGVARDIKERVRMLQLGNPADINLEHFIPHTHPHIVERAAHTSLWARRIHGEWFRISTQDAFDAIQCAIRATDGVPNRGLSDERYNRTTDALIDKAADAVLNLGWSSYAAGKHFGVNESTVRGRVSKVRRMVAQSMEIGTP